MLYLALFSKRINSDSLSWVQQCLPKIPFYSEHLNVALLGNKSLCKFNELRIETGSYAVRVSSKPSESVLRREEDAQAQGNRIVDTEVETEVMCPQSKTLQE